MGCQPTSPNDDLVVSNEPRHLDSAEARDEGVVRLAEDNPDWWDETLSRLGITSCSTAVSSQVNPARRRRNPWPTSHPDGRIAAKRRRCCRRARWCMAQQIPFIKQTHTNTPECQTLVSQQTFLLRWLDQALVHPG